VLAGADDERPVGGDVTLATEHRLLVERRLGEVPVDAAEMARPWFSSP